MEILLILIPITLLAIIISNWIRSKDLKNCYIFDIDGTLAHRLDRRGPHDLKKVDLDAPDDNVIKLNRILYIDLIKYSLFQVEKNIVEN